MATWLNEFQKRKKELASQAAKAPLTLDQLIQYQEVGYRIEVLEACQTICGSAPITTEVSQLSIHYQLADAFLRSISAERRIGQPTDEKGKAGRQAAISSLNTVLADCQKRFSSFHPSSPEQYKNAIGSLIATVLPVWLQMRNTFVDINR